MARVTVEDCVLNESNRFKLTLLASKRARQLAGGAQLTIPRDNDKDPIVALREIAEKTVGIDMLENELIQDYQLHKPNDEDEADLDLEFQRSIGTEWEKDETMETMMQRDAQEHFGSQSEEDLQDA
jgi:DNA-directed RNA polymerase subunit omega